MQQIIHSQEVPEYSKVHTFPCTEDECIAGKIFVIDDGEYCTMCGPNFCALKLTHELKRL